MSKEQHHTKQLEQHISQHGIEGLLPQNLSDGLLERVNQEGDALEAGMEEKIPPSILLMIVLYLKNGKKINNGKDLKIQVSQTKLLEYFSIFITAARLEDMRRKKDVTFEQESLPTIKNIFNTERKMKIEWLR